MRFHDNLRQRLHDRRERLSKATESTYATELKQLLAYIETTPYLRALTEELTSGTPDVTWSDWRRRLLQQTHKRREIQLPDDELATAKVAYGLIQECAKEGSIERYIWLVTTHAMQAFPMPTNRMAPMASFKPLPPPKVDLAQFSDLLIDPFCAI